MTICTHCKRLDEEHISLKCLFSPTLFAPIRCVECQDVLHTCPSTAAGRQYRDDWFQFFGGVYYHNFCYSTSLRRKGET